nr:hypothetical protein [Tanacetum cinerariifolium]
MARPVQNINHSASAFTAAPAADSDAQEEGKPVDGYVLKMKGYFEQLERLSYVLPQDLSVGLSLNGLIRDFVRFVRNYNMHNIGKTIGEIHALLIEYEKGLPKKTKTPQVMMIKSGKILKAYKKSLKAKGKGKANGNGKDKQFHIPKPKNPKPTAKEHPTKDDNCHHYKELGKMTRKSFPRLTERKTGLLGIIHTDMCGPLRHVSRQCASYFITFTDDYSRFGCVYLLKHKNEVFETFKVFKNEVENQLEKTIKALRSYRGDYVLESTKRILNMVPTKKVDKAPYELWYGKVPNLSYLKETMGYYFYFPPENKIIVTRYAEFFEKNLITREVSGRAIDLEEIQDEDTSPSEFTSKISMDVDGFEPPQKEVIPIRRSERTHQAPNRLCLNVEAEEHNIGDLNEPTSYKAAMLDSKKTDMDGIVHTYKARFIAKGYTQLYEVDYEETFSPVVDIRAIRILISIAAFYVYEIWQMDVKTAFLKGYLDEDIYMASGSNVTFLILYVDDIIIMGNHIPRLQSVKDYLGKCFFMKDLGEATFIFGIKIYRDMSKPLIGLGQNAYMDKILKRYKMDNSKRGRILMQERIELNKTQGASTPKEVKHMQNIPYASVVGSIMYAVRCTRPDVAFTQNITSRFQQNPGVVEWKSSKQSTTTMSAKEAEYIATSEAAMKAVWITKFISGLGIVPTINEPIKMFCDNSATLHFDNESGVQKGIRHYHRRCHYVRESIEKGEIKFLKVHTDDNLADPFTKALPKGKLTQHARSM